MPVINISDFSGGRNTYDEQLMLADNQCATGSVNVWAPRKALTKVAGTVLFASFTATASSRAEWFAYEPGIASAYTMYYRIHPAAGGGVNTGNHYPWASLAATDSLTPLGYTTGTVSVSGASLISATGSGTTWSTHVSAGDRFRVDASASSWYKVSSVEDNTHLTLASALPSAAATGSAYMVQPAIGVVEVAHAALGGNLLMSVISDAVQIFDGTGMLRQTTQRVAFLQIFKNYMFGARTSTAESRLYWSAIKDPTSWPAANFIDIDKDRGKITGLRAFGNELIVFKNRGMFKVVGEVFDASNPTYAVYQITTPENFSFNNNKAVAEYKGDLLFLAERYVYAYRHGTNSIERISKLWDGDITRTPSDPNSVVGGSQRVSAIAFDGKWIIKTIDGNSTDCGFLDENGAWWLVRNEGSTAGEFEVSMMAVFQPENAAAQLILGENDAGRLFEWKLAPTGKTYEDQFIDSAINSGTKTAITATWLSKEFNVGYAHFRKAVIYLLKQAAGTLSFDWSIDQGSFVTNSVDMTVGRGQLIRRSLDISQNGSTIQLRIKNSTVDQTFKVFGIQVFYDSIEEDRKA